MNASAAADRDALAAFFEAHGHVKSFGFLVAMATCSVVGVVGNGVTLSVLSSRLRSAARSRFAFRNHYNYFTCALAASDMFVCAVWIPYEALVSVRGLIVNDALCKTMGFLSNAAIIFAAISHFGICVERYYAVRKPTSPVSATQMNAVVSGVAALSLAMSIPAVFTYSIDAGQATGDWAKASCYLQYDSDIGLYYNVALGAVLSASIVTMLCLYSAVFRVILTRLLQRRHRSNRAAGALQLDKMSSSAEPSCETSQQQTEGDAHGSANAGTRHTTIAASSRVVFMFFFVTLVFYASWLPFFLSALDIIERNIIIENSHFVNSCTNFILYSIFNAELRREMLQRFTCAGRQKRVLL